jgi:hypothetical protein
MFARLLGLDTGVVDNFRPMLNVRFDPGTGLFRRAQLA